MFGNFFSMPLIITLSNMNAAKDFGSRFVQFIEDKSGNTNIG